jgi:DNA-binding transcriptional MocR family regulator
MSTRVSAASLEELMKHLGASPASIRRDLAKLQHQGLIRRTHGGAILIEPLLYEPFRYDSLFQTRVQHRPAEKRRIGAAAAELIREHETIGFTAGTTTTQVARNLRNRHHQCHQYRHGAVQLRRPADLRYRRGRTVGWLFLAGRTSRDQFPERNLSRQGLCKRLRRRHHARHHRHRTRGKPDIRPT